jgi:hypothetical protein
MMAEHIVMHPIAFTQDAVTMNRESARVERLPLVN